MALQWPPKSPVEVLDYGINWQAALGTDTIVTSTWMINAADLVEDSSTFGPVTTTIFLSGGTLNYGYAVDNIITTAGGRTFQQTVNISVRFK